MPWNIIQFPKSSMLLCSTIPDEYIYIIMISYNIIWLYILSSLCSVLIVCICYWFCFLFYQPSMCPDSPPPLYFLKWMLQQWHTWEASSSGMGWWWPPCCRRGQPGSPHPTQASRTIRQCRFSKEILFKLMHKKKPCTHCSSYQIIYM